MNIQPVIPPLFAAALFTLQAHASPHAAGRIVLDPQTGFIDGRICLRNRPPESANTFTLNAGLSIAHIRTADGQPSLDYRGFFDGEIYGDGRIYSVDLAAEESICVEYVGAAPVFDKRDAFLDWKGRLATDGRIFRLTEQSAWLPLPIQTEVEKIYTQITYEIEVECEACETIYISGSEPVPGGHAVLRSDHPVQPILLAGQYESRNIGGLWVLDSELTSEEAQVLSEGFSRITDIQADYLGVPYGETPVFMEFDNLDHVRRPNRGWGFVSWPTIAFGGVQSLGMLAEAFQNSEDAESRDLIGYVAHEAAHFYFGTHHQPSGAYAPFFLESTAEYLSLVTLGEMLGDDARKKRLQHLAKDLYSFDGEMPKLHEITRPPDQRLSIWRYVYGPLVLQSLHDFVGAEGAAALLGAMVRAEETPRDWAALTDLASHAGISEGDWNDWVSSCLEPALENSCLSQYQIEHVGPAP